MDVGPSFFCRASYTRVSPGSSVSAQPDPEVCGRSRPFLSVETLTLHSVMSRL